MSKNIIFEKPLLKGRLLVFNSPPDFQFLKIKQIHSNTILTENKCTPKSPADGIIGSSLIPKGIATADCIPLVLIGEKKHAIVHAGWRGLAQNILSNTNLLNIKPLYVFIGPHIRSCHYEVQNDFSKNFFLFPEAFSCQNGKTYFNLETVAICQLKKLFPDIIIETCKLCTFSESQFHSYRRNQTTERNWNIYFPE